MADIYDPSEGVAPPSDDLTDPGKPAPEPKSFPIKKMGQIRMSGWTIYAEGEKLYAKSPKGVKTQIVLYDPEGLTEEAKPNKVSDGSDGSSDSKGLTTYTKSGTTTEAGSISTPGTSVASVPDTGIIAASDNNFEVVTENVSIDTNTNIEIIDNAVDELAVIVDQADEQVVFQEPDNVYETTPILTPQQTTSALQVFTGTKPSGEYKGTYFLNQDEQGKPNADSFLGRTLESDEWDDLISAVNSELNGGSVLDKAWVMGTILNRARKSGLLVGQVLLDARQFPTVGPNPSNKFREGPNDEIDSQISQAAMSLGAVSKNNYYYSKTVSRNMVKGGVKGIPIGSITVFPGARWP